MRSPVFMSFGDIGSVPLMNFSVSSDGNVNATAVLSLHSDTRSTDIHDGSHNMLLVTVCEECCDSPQERRSQTENASHKSLSLPCLLIGVFILRRWVPFVVSSFKNFSSCCSSMSSIGLLGFSLFIPSTSCAVILGRCRIK